MTFVIKQITPRAAGGTIERVKRVDSPQILVGRAVAADIHLEDLAVQLEHVLIRDIGQGRVEVEPVDKAAVQIDRKLIGTVQLALSRAPVLIVGGEKLELGPGEALGEIAIKVERLETGGELHNERDVFALGSALPNRRTMAWAGIAAVLALFLAWPILSQHRTQASPQASAQRAAADNQRVARVPVAFSPDQTWDAGPLSPGHKFLSKDCASCHRTAFKTVSDQDCLSCHAGLKRGMMPSQALRDHADPKRLIASHGMVPNFAGRLRAAVGPHVGLKEWSCTGCHKEHTGVDATPISSDQFCAGCHAAMKSRLPDTKLVNVASWETHPQFRPLITDNSGDEPRLMRLSLADKPREESGLKFPHALHLSSMNAVAQMTRRLSGRYGGEGALGCADCHRTDQDGVRFQKIEMERDCAACHTLAFAVQDGTIRTLRHGEPAQVVAELRDYLKLRGPASEMQVARTRIGLAFDERGQIRGRETVRTYGGSVPNLVRAVFEKGGACYDCHVIERPARLQSLAYEVKPVTSTERYLQRGWFSHADHATANSPCTTCHAAKTSNSSADLLLPGVATCQQCHGGLHPAAGKVASPCSSCHSYHSGPGAPASARAGPTTPIARQPAASPLPPPRIADRPVPVRTALDTRPERST